MASKRTRRLIALGAFAAAAAAGPAIAATTISTSAPQDYQAGPGQCLAWFGNQEDGKCLGYSNGQPINAGTPFTGVWGPNGPNGVGVSTPGMLPGQTITSGVN